MTKQTKVTFNNPEDPNSGYTIENPYETKVRFSTPNLNKEGFIDIPKITVIGLINFLYVGEGTERDGRLGFRSKAVSELTFFKPKPGVILLVTYDLPEPGPPARKKALKIPGS